MWLRGRRHQANNPVAMKLGANDSPRHYLERLVGLVIAREHERDRAGDGEDADHPKGDQQPPPAVVAGAQSRYG